MKKTVIFLFLILCMTAVNTGCQKKQETDFILENPKEHTDNEKQQNSHYHKHNPALGVHNSHRLLSDTPQRQILTPHH